MRVCQPPGSGAISRQPCMPKKPLPADVKVLIGMAAVLAIPFALTLNTVTRPRSLVTDLAANPTPLGYTWSLALFIVPALVLAAWVSFRKPNPVQKKAFWITTALLSSTGILLDVFFSLSFFTFVNRDATIGIMFWGYSFSEGWQKVLPINQRLPSNPSIRQEGGACRSRLRLEGC
jgi:hypothetical protein